VDVHGTKTARPRGRFDVSPTIVEFAAAAHLRAAGVAVEDLRVMDAEYPDCPDARLDAVVAPSPCSCSPILCAPWPGPASAPTLPRRRGADLALVLQLLVALGTTRAGAMVVYRDGCFQK